MNGVVVKEFKCRRGVRQGDPLSPLLFAIAADLLQCVTNHEMLLSNLHPPFPQDPNTPFSVVQYADDTILIMLGCEQQLLHLKDILKLLTLSSGLKVNYHKSCLLPINIESGKASLLANYFGCAVGVYPFTLWDSPSLMSKTMLHSYVGSREDYLLALSSCPMLADCNLSTLSSYPCQPIIYAPSSYLWLLLKSLTNIGKSVSGGVVNSKERDTIWLPGV